MKTWLIHVAARVLPSAWVEVIWRHQRATAAARRLRAGGVRIPRLYPGDVSAEGRG